MPYARYEYDDDSYSNESSSLIKKKVVTCTGTNKRKTCSLQPLPLQ